MRTTWDEYFIQMAHAAAARGTCPRLKVGAVLVDKDRNVISTGYNGAPPGALHCFDVGCDLKDGSCKRTLHAERNAISRSSMSQRAGSVLYVTDYPCVECAELIATKGIVEVVFDRPYWRGMDVDFFHQNGIVVRSIGE